MSRFSGVFRSAVGAVVLVGALSLVLVSAVPAASTKSTASGNYVGPPLGVMPDGGSVFGAVAALHKTAASRKGTRRLLTSCPQPAPDPGCNLTYHGGPLMLTNTTHIVYWEPAGSSVSANYHSLLERYLTDVAAASGRATNVYAITTQYTDSVPNNIQYSSTFAGALTDTDPYPATVAGCPLTDGTNTVANCLTETQQATELDNFIQANSLPRGINNLYFLVMPKNVETCYDDFSDCGNLLDLSPRYCAYHSSFNISGHGLTLWANEPYIGISLGHCASATTPSPNADDADHEINPLSHEHNEAITDPTGGGWYDVDGTGENGDKCNFNFGTPIGSNSNGAYNQLINHNPYEIQQEWSNASTGCALTFGAAAPTAAFTFSPPSPKALDTVSFDGTSSHSNNTGGYITDYSWTFGDGGVASSATPTHAYGAPGNYTVTLKVTDDAGLTDTTTQQVTVVQRPTTTLYTGPASSDFNDPVTLGATLTDTSSSTAVTGKTIVFTLGTQTCSGTTDGSGHATCTFTITQDPGTATTVSASFGGDSVYLASNDAKPFTITREESKVTYTGALTSHYHDKYTATATLTDPVESTPIVGKTIKFTLNGSLTDTCTAITDGSGVATCSITPTQASGTVNMVASFAGDVDYVPSNDSQSFAITPEETTTTYIGPTVILQGGSGVTLKAQMVEDGANDSDGDGGSPAPVPAGRSVKLSLGSQSCVGLTDASGIASCMVVFTGALGPQPLKAEFLGDSFYSASSDTSKTAIVFAFPSRGAFALGNLTAAGAGPTTSVPWWGASWWLGDTLTGGTAPASFKGFAASVVSLPNKSPANVCGSTFTTGPGNSSSPPGDVPSYMGVLVASSVTQSGSTISGTWGKIVVVHVDPGYAANPGHPGTGTIVATFCP